MPDATERHHLLAAHAHATLLAFVAAAPLAILLSAYGDFYGSYRQPGLGGGALLALPLGVVGRALVAFVQRSVLAHAWRRRAVPPTGAPIIALLLAVDLAAVALLAAPAFLLAVLLHFTYASGALTLCLLPTSLLSAPLTVHLLRRRVTAAGA